MLASCKYQGAQSVVQRLTETGGTKLCVTLGIILLCLVMSGCEHDSQVCELASILLVRDNGGINLACHVSFCNGLNIFPLIEQPPLLLIQLDGSSNFDPDTCG